MATILNEAQQSRGVPPRGRSAAMQGFDLAIDDKTATDIYNRIDATEGVERDVLATQLENWASRKMAESQTTAAQEHERIYTDLDGWWADRGGDDVPEDVKFGAANRKFIADQFNQSASEQGDLYPSYRDQYFLKTYGKAPASESEAYKTISESVMASQKVNQSYDLITGDIALALFDQVNKGTPVDIPALFTKWKEENAETLAALPDDWEANALKAAGEYYAENEQMLREHGDVLQRLYARIVETTGRKVEGAPEDDVKTVEDLNAIIDELGQLPKEVRDRGYTAILMAARRQGMEDKGFWEMAAEAWPRTLNTVRTTGLVAQETDAEAKVNLLRGDNPLFINKATGQVTPPSGTAFSPQDFEPVTGERRAELLQQAETELQRFNVIRELRDLADNRFDPVKSNAKNGVLKFVQDIALMGPQSLAYTAMAAVPVAGPILTGAAIYADEYNQLRLEGFSSAQSRTLSLVSAPLQTAAEVLGAKLIFGRFKWYRETIQKLINPARFARSSQAAVSFFGKVVGENITEGFQDLATPLVKDVAAALSEEYPDVNWEETLGQWKDSRLEVLAATLMPVIGGSLVETFNNNERFASAKRRVQLLYKPMGITDEEVRYIEDGTTPEERNKRYTETLKNMPAERVQQIKDRIAAESRAATATQEDPTQPTLETQKDANGRLTYIVRDETGKEVYRSTKQAAAEEAFILTTARSTATKFANDRLIVKDLVAQWESEDPNNVARTGQTETAQQILDRLTAENNVAQIEVLHRRIAQSSYAGTPYDQIQILGEATVEDIGNMVFRGVITLNESSRPQDAREEMHHVAVRRALGTNRVTLDQLREWLAASEGVLGTTLARETQDDIVESLALVQRAYEDGQIDAGRETQLPPSFVDYIKRMIAAFAEVLKRAVALREAFAAGTLPQEYEAFLAETTGVSQQEVVDRARERTEQEVASTTLNYSIGLTPQMDAEYLEAVERGDMETAQRMVDEAAKAAGFNTRPLYHGTEQGEIREITKPFFLSTSKKEATAYSELTDVDEFVTRSVIPASEAAIQLPQSFPQNDYGWPDFQDYVGEPFVAVFNGNTNEIFYWDGTENAYGDKNIVVIADKLVDENNRVVDGRATTRPTRPPQVNPFVGKYYVRGTFFDGGDSRFAEDGAPSAANIIGERLGGTPELIEQWRTFLAERGHAGVETFSDDIISIKQFIVFNPTAIKSADPVTYDANGNVIPLSQRFDAGTANINYSIVASVEHLKNDTRFDKLVQDGRVFTGVDVNDFIDQHILLHLPDNAFAGTIRLTDGGEIKGKGGVYYPVLYADKNYFWASTEAMVMRTAAHLNEIGAKNGGRILMGLVSAPVEKLFSSTSMATGVVKFLNALTNDSRAGLSKDDLNKMLIAASKVEVVVQTKTKTTKKTFSTKLKASNGYAKNFAKIDELLAPDGSIFQVRKAFVESLAEQVSKHLNATPATAEYVAGILADAENKHAKNAIKRGKLSKASFLQGLGNMLTEPFLRDFQEHGNGKIYAIVEVQGEVKGIPTTEHESYPATIVPVNKKSKVKLHVLKEAVDWQDVVGKDSGQYTTPQERLNLMPTSGMSSTELKVLGVKAGSSAASLNYSIGSRAQPDVERNVITLPDVTISGPANYSIAAWHGSPAEFDEFLLEYIGTGEGAQVYGWGLYFAQLQEVARKYRENLAGRSSFDSILVDGQPIDSTDETQKLAEQAVVGPLIGNGDVQKAIAALEQEDNFDPVAQWLKERADRITIKPEEFKGALYEVSIDASENDLLDWDSPLSQQSKVVQQAFQWSDGDALATIIDAFGQSQQLGNRTNASEAYRLLGAPEKASQYLLSKGIKGIRYLDQGSRVSPKDIAKLAELRTEVAQLTETIAKNEGKDWAERKMFTDWLASSSRDLAAMENLVEVNKPTYNYVIFDDSLIKILTRNGEQISVEQAAKEVSNYSISTQSEIDRVQAAMDRLARSPSERIAQYAALKERLAAALERNQPIMQSMRGDTLPQDFDRTRILNDLGFLDYILKVLPPEVRGRVGGYTNLAGIAPVDVYKGDQKVSEAKNPAGAIISAWMREGLNIGQAQKKTELPEGYSTVANTTDERRDKTIANFLIDRLKKIDRELERYYKRDLMKRIFDVLDKSRPKAGESGVKRSTLGAETQKFADMVYRASLLDDEKTAETLAAIEAKITSTEATDESQKRLSELSEEWTIVNTFGDLKNRPSETLAYGLEWLQEQLKAGREAWQIKEAARIQENRERAAKVIAFLGKPTDIGRFKNKSALQRFLQATNAYDLDHKSFEQFAFWLFGDEVAAELSEKIQRANISEAKAELENTRTILAAMRQGAKAAGMKTGKALVMFKENQSSAVRKLEGRKVKDTKIPIELAKKIVRGLADRGSLSQADVQTLADELAALPRDTKKEFVTIKQVIFRGEEVRLTMSRSQAMQLWLTWQQSDAQEKMRRDGFTDDSFEDLDNLISDPFSQAILRVTQRIYGSGYPLTNPIYARMFGMNMPMVKNYAPARYLSSKEVKDVGLDGSPLTAGGQPSFAKSRVNHTAKLAPEDALTVLQSHIAQQAHWVAFAEVTREYRSLLANPEVRESIRQRFGEDVLRSAEMWGDQMEQRGGNKGREIAVINNALGAIIGGQSVSLLGLNLKSISMQTDNLMRFFLALNSRQIASALSDPVALMRNIRKVWKTDIIQTRLQGGATAETRFLFNRFVSMFRRGAKISELAMMPMNYTDSAGLSVSGAIVYQAAYKDALDSGMDERSAEQAATDAVEAMVYRYGQPVLMGQKSNIENSGGVFAKTFFLFMSDPRLKMAIISDAVRGLATGRGDWKDHVRRIVAIELMALVSHVLATGFRDLTSDDDDEDLWSMGGFARALLLAPFQGYFFLGSVSDLVLSRLTESKWFTPTQDPFLRTVNTAMRAVNNLDNAFNFDDPDALVKEWTDITRSIALTPPLAAPAVIMNLVRPLVQAWERMDDDE